MTVVPQEEVEQYHHQLTKEQAERRWQKSQFLLWLYHALMLGLGCICIILGACFDLGTTSGAMAADPSKLWIYYGLNLGLGVGSGIGFLFCFVASMCLDSRILGSLVSIALGLVLIGFGTSMVLSTNAPDGSGNTDKEFWVDKLIGESNPDHSPFTLHLKNIDTSSAASVIRNLNINGTSVQDIILPLDHIEGNPITDFFQFVHYALEDAVSVKNEFQGSNVFWDVVYSLLGVSNNGKKHEFLFSNHDILTELQELFKTSYCTQEQLREKFNDHFQNACPAIYSTDHHPGVCVVRFTNLI